MTGLGLHKLDFGMLFDMEKCDFDEIL